MPGLRASSQEFRNKINLILKYFVSRNDRDKYVISREDIPNNLKTVIIYRMMTFLQAQRDNILSRNPLNHMREYFNSSEIEKRRLIEIFLEYQVYFPYSNESMPLSESVNNEGNNSSSDGSNTTIEPASNGELSNGGRARRTSIRHRKRKKTNKRRKSRKINRKKSKR